MTYSKTIAVIGARDCDKEMYRVSEELGYLLAKNGFVIICGGLGGVMEATCKGAKKYGGVTIGILPGSDPQDANSYVDTVIPTGMGISRNLIIIRAAAGVIAVNGGFGTLSELAFALQMQKPVVGLNTWDVSDKIFSVATPQEAVSKISGLLQKQ
jgi:uncharacterized protein (TIGR00725 family)